MTVRLQLLMPHVPFVKRIQRQAADLVREGYQVVIVGQEDHPEVKGYFRLGRWRSSCYSSYC